jgi:hypothetical protein
MATLKRGSKGADVIELQEHLRRWGYPVGKIDGDYGPATEGAVTQFQMAEGLSIDGKAGPKTIAHLRSGPSPATDPGRVPSVVSASVQGRMVAAAAMDLGKRESPSGSNNGPAISHLCDGYNAQKWLQIPGPDKAAWCAKAALVWACRAMGLGDRGDEIEWPNTIFGAWRGSTVSEKASDRSLLSWAKEHGCLAPASGPAPEGAIYVMYREGSGSDLTAGSAAGHVGVVVEDNGDGTFDSIDGNVSNMVKRCKRKKSDVIGYIEWWKVIR